jgi:hypothetical protein
MTTFGSLFNPCHPSLTVRGLCYCHLYNCWIPGAEIFLIIKTFSVMSDSWPKVNSKLNDHAEKHALFLVGWILSSSRPYLLTPWSGVLLEKLTGFAASQQIPRISGTRKFINVLTSARQLSLSWARSIQSPQLPPTSWRSLLILSSHLRLGLPNGLFPSGFPTKTLCPPLPSPIRATCPAAQNI